MWKAGGRERELEEVEWVEEVGAKACVESVGDAWYLAESRWKVTGR